MKVLHVTSGNLFGGIERHLLTLASRDAGKTGLSHEFAVCFEGQFASMLRDRGVEVRRLSAVRTRWPWTRFWGRRVLGEVLRASRPDVVMVHSNWALCHFGSMLERGPAPLVFWLHDFVSERRWMDRWAGRSRPGLVLCNSVCSMGRLEEAGWFGTIPKRVLHPASELSDPEDAWADRRRVRGELGVGEGARVVVQAGRWARSKGHDRILEAMAQEPLDREEWQYWIAGGAGSREERKWRWSVEALAVTLGLADRVRVLGHREDMGAVMHAADVYVHPCQEAETFGLVLVEALGAGLKIVASDLGGAKEILGGGYGELVDPYRARLWREAIGRAVGGGKTVEDVERGRAHARALCDPAGVCERLLAILREHANGGNRLGK